MGFLMGCENVHLEYPVKLIFDNLTLGIEEGDRMGIVGSNGDGKTSLLQLLARTVEPDSGRITARNGLRVGYLQQHDSLDPDATVAHSVVGDVDEHEWASDPRVRGIINGIIGDVPWDGLVRNLSGGQRRRVDIARVLVGDHDVILLDEPTNHLDMRAIAWLAAHLQQRWNRKEGALLVVTHDRWFLDEVCTAMLEIHDGIAEPFEGGASARRRSPGRSTTTSCAVSSPGSPAVPVPVPPNPSSTWRPRRRSSPRSRPSATRSSSSAAPCRVWASR